MTTYHGVQAKVGAKATTPAFTDADDVINFNLEQSRELIERYILGSEDPQELKAGKIAINGSFSKHFDGTNFSAMALTLKDLCDAGTVCFFALFPEGDALPKIDCENAKVSRWRVEVGLDGLVTETVDFRGLAVTIT